MRIERLPAGSYVSGVVIVKTRAVHMPIKGERTLQGSVLNVDLERVRVRSIQQLVPMLHGVRFMVMASLLAAAMRRAGVLTRRPPPGQDGRTPRTLADVPGGV